jgi:hypothetical protein
MLELEAFEPKRAKPEIAVQYIDNLLQTDYKIWMIIFFAVGGTF